MTHSRSVGIGIKNDRVLMRNHTTGDTFTISIHDAKSMANDILSLVDTYNGIEPDHTPPPDSTEMRLRQVENAVKGFNDRLDKVGAKITQRIDYRAEEYEELRDRLADAEKRLQNVEMFINLIKKLP